MGADLVLASRTEARLLEQQAEVVAAHGAKGARRGHRRHRRGLAGEPASTRRSRRSAGSTASSTTRSRSRRWTRSPRSSRASCAPGQRDQRLRAAAALGAVRRRAGGAQGLDHHAQLLRRRSARSRSTPATSCRRARSSTSPRRWPPSSARAASGSTAWRRRTSTRTSTAATSTSWPPVEGKTHEQIYAEKAGADRPQAARVVRGGRPGDAVPRHRPGLRGHRPDADRRLRRVPRLSDGAEPDDATTIMAAGERARTSGQLRGHRRAAVRTTGHVRLRRHRARGGPAGPGRGPGLAGGRADAARQLLPALGGEERAGRACCSPRRSSPRTPSTPTCRSSGRSS